jgi:hypothetical protein
VTAGVRATSSSEIVTHECFTEKLTVTPSEQYWLLKNNLSSLELKNFHIHHFVKCSILNI